MDRWIDGQMDRWIDGQVNRWTIDSDIGRRTQKDRQNYFDGNSFVVQYNSGDKIYQGKDESQFTPRKNEKRTEKNSDAVITAKELLTSIMFHLNLQTLFFNILDNQPTICFNPPPTALQSISFILLLRYDFISFYFAPI